MPEVPPDPPEPDDRPADATPSDERPPAGPPGGTPSGPFDQPRPPEPAGPPQEAPSGAPPPFSPPPRAPMRQSAEAESRVEPPEPYVPVHARAPGAGVSAIDALSTSTLGVPHYDPPAPTPIAPPPAGATVAPPVGAPAPAAAPALPFPEIAAPAPPAPPRSILRPLGRGVRELAETIILALLIFLLVRSVVQNFQVEGRSMEPTFEHRWYVLVNKALYWEINLNTLSKFVPFLDPGDDPTRYLFRGPRRGDVIVFKAPTQPASAPERDFIKRIVGLPGEEVEVHDCTVFIDGEPLDEPYIAEAPMYTYGPEVVPQDSYFVLGDNRNNSSDSHSWGMLPKENIIGQAWVIYWPFSAFGLVDNTSVKPGVPNGELSEPSSAKPVAACPSTAG